jgi:hypothetical protein
MNNQRCLVFFLLAACSQTAEQSPLDGGGADGYVGNPTDAGADMTPQASGCLDEKAFAGDIVINGAFPFCVKRRLVATKAVLGAHWGQHGGPIVTSDKVVIRYGLPAQVGGVLTATEVTFKVADNLPAMFFYGADGMVDLPFGPYALYNYTTSGTVAPGELLLYAKDYDQVVSRAKVNGIYSNVGIANGTGGRVFYTGLSGLTMAATTTSDNGLYGSDLCSGALVPTGTCPVSRKLLSWTGFSGPVTSDQSGNVFVAASISGGAHSDEFYGLTKAEALGTALVPAVALAVADTMGTSSMAAVAPQSDKPGWLLAKGYDFGAVSPAYAQAYKLVNNKLEKSGTTLVDVVKPGTGSKGFTLFTDNSGALWIASKGATESAFLELQPKP